MEREGFETVQTITISKDDTGMWFATSEDEPSIFVASTSREGVTAALGTFLTPPPAQ